MVVNYAQKTAHWERKLTCVDCACKRDCDGQW